MPYHKVLHADVESAVVDLESAGEVVTAVQAEGDSLILFTQRVAARGAGGVELRAAS